ncbi:MAG: lamin tail domain-containing protein [Bacteroidetes bacterium]|nr:lamin tail domain-containing protein [Bacteroidota bacterium]
MKKLLLILVAVAFVQFAKAQCSDLFISEYVEGTFNNKALEIYNPTSNTISLTNYRFIRWSNGSTTSDANPAYVLYPTGTIAANDVKVFVIDKRDPLATGADTIVWASLIAMADTFVCPVYATNSVLYFNGDDALSIQKNVGGVWSNIDIFGLIGERPTDYWGGTSGGWTSTAPYNDGSGVYVTKDKTLIRKSSVKSGVSVNPASFNALAEYDSLAVNTFTNLGTHVCDCNVGVEEYNQVQVNIFPNPVTSSQLFINAEKPVLIAEISNLIGQVVSSEVFENRATSVNLQINKNLKGVYFLKLYFDNNQSVVKKISIQ